MIVFVVTCWYEENEPIITVWNNKENAEKHLNYCKGKYKNTIMDKCQVYSRFKMEE